MKINLPSFTKEFKSNLKLLLIDVNSLLTPILLDLMIELKITDMTSPVFAYAPITASIPKVAIQPINCSVLKFITSYENNYSARSACGEWNTERLDLCVVI